MSQHRRACIVKDHPAYMQHAPDDIDGMFRAVKMFLQLLIPSIAVLYLNIIPAVYIHFLNAGTKDIFG